MTFIRDIISAVAAFFVRLFTHAPAAATVGTSAAAIDARAARLPARIREHRSGRAIFTKSEIDRAHRNRRNFIARCSRRRNRALG